MSLEDFLREYKPYQTNLFPLDPERTPITVDVKGFFELLPRVEIEETFFSTIDFGNFMNASYLKKFITKDVYDLYVENEETAREEIEKNKNKGAFNGHILGLDGFYPSNIGGKGIIVAIREVLWSDQLATNRSIEYRNLILGYSLNKVAFLANGIGTNDLLIIEYDGGVYATVIGTRTSNVDYAGKITLMGGYLDNDYLNAKKVREMLKKGKQPQHLTAVREFLEEFPEIHPLWKDVKRNAITKIYLPGYNREDHHPDSDSILYLRRHTSLEEDLKLLEEVGTSTKEAVDIQIVTLGDIARKVVDESYFDRIVEPQRPMFAVAAYMAKNTAEKLKYLGF